MKSAVNFDNSSNKAVGAASEETAPTGSHSTTETNVCSIPLDGVDSAVPSFQLHPVFGAVSNRVPPNNTMSCFIAFGDRSWDTFKNSP